MLILTLVYTSFVFLSCREDAAEHLWTSRHCNLHHILPRERFVWHSRGWADCLRISWCYCFTVEVVWKGDTRFVLSWFTFCHNNTVVPISL